VITFTYGTNMGSYQASRHLRGLVSPHEISAPANQHTTPGKLNLASTDVINQYSRLEVTRLRGDGSRVAVDGTQMDTWSDNLPAESSIRYGGYGGIAYRHVSGTYIVLFSHFIPVAYGRPSTSSRAYSRTRAKFSPTIHTDTQGQSLPAYGLAEMLGFDLLPRIRNWHGLIFYRPSPETRYQHIDSLFGDDPRNVINWKLTEAHWVDLVRTVISIREARVSSVVLLHRLSNDSKKNRLYRAFRELGRVVRTIVLLRYLSEPELREGITAITNRVEAFHGFSKWLTFGNAGVISDNDPDTMEKIVKFNELLANCLIFHTSIEFAGA
jgi:TnpA family transposase